MDRTLKTACNICHQDAECRHLDLYVFGSEGVWLCHECEMLVNAFIEMMARHRMRLVAMSYRKEKRRERNS